MKGSVQPFDWTFTTDYSGTLTGQQTPILVQSDHIMEGVRYLYWYRWRTPQRELIIVA